MTTRTIPFLRQVTPGQKRVQVIHVTRVTLEQHVRRLAKKYGYVLRKSRSRNPQRTDYGLYALLDQETGRSVLRPDRYDLKSPFGSTLEQVSDFLAMREGPAVAFDKHGNRARRP